MDEKLLSLINILNTKNGDELLEYLESYHEADIADAFQELDEERQKYLFTILPNEILSDIISNLDDVADYTENIEPEKLADIVEEMEPDDAVKFLDELDEDIQDDIIDELEPDVKEDIDLIQSYNDDQIGSLMTTDFVVLNKNTTVKEAMKQVIKDAENIEDFSVLYVLDDDNSYIGLVLLKDLICARSTDDFINLIKENYPTLNAKESLENSKDTLLDYDLDSVAILDDNNHMLGIVSKDQIIYVLQRETTEDYNKLAGINDNETDIHEKTLEAVKIRLPWLLFLMIIGLIVSAITSRFEAIISSLTTVVFFQALVSGMGGNVGTQSLALTIQNIDNEEKAIKKLLKELLSGLLIGLVLALVGFGIVILSLLIIKEPHQINLESFKVAATVSIALFVGSTLSAFVGSFVPLVLTKLRIDPAAASGPFITTFNDIIATVIYYLLATIIFNIIL